MRTIDEIEARKAEITAELEKPEADLDALEAEVRALNTEAEEIRKNAAAEAEKRRKIAEAAEPVTVIETREMEETKMTLMEIRKSTEYVNAWADYIKSGDDREVRKLLSENAPENGTIPVPVILQERIETAWENNEILNRVTRTDIRGNLKVPFELTADDAVVHAEGGAEVTEEGLTFGMVELKPESIKKWVSFSDEVADLKGQAFLDYIYDEITYRQMKKTADLLVDDVVNAPAANSANAIGVPAVAEAPSVTAVPTAAANLSEDATGLVVVMNRLTEVEFLKAAALGNFSIDPFAGLPRVYTSHLKAYSAASSGETYAIVGDLRGLQVNYPAGRDIEIKYDDLTKKKEDLIEVLGRQFAGHGVTKLGRLAKIIKA